MTEVNNNAQDLQKNFSRAEEPANSTASASAKTQAAEAAPPFMRTIKSFVRRTGRVTIGQGKALQTMGHLLLPYEVGTAANPTHAVQEAGHTFQPLDYAQAFGRTAPTVLEIGFGMGEATAHIACVLPEVNFLCCEVHEPGVGALLKRIDEQRIANIRIMAHDAVEVLKYRVADASLAGVHIFFPDPWHKLRHNKRRLIQPAFVQVLCQKLQPGGYLHCATDWQPYAQQIMQVLSSEALLKNTGSQDGGYAQKPHYRPETKFERRGLRLGHGVWDLVFQRV